jgi:hypothetical protein
MRPLYVALILSAGCQTPGVLTPGTGPGTAYPCGIDGVVCSDSPDGGPLAPTGMCCTEGQVCGGAFPNVGCPSGMCCAEGLSFGGDAGRRVAPVAKQYPANR